jgi:hypothetical protein
MNVYDIVVAQYVFAYVFHTQNKFNLSNRLVLAVTGRQHINLMPKLLKFFCKSAYNPSKAALNRRFFTD